MKKVLSAQAIIAKHIESDKIIEFVATTDDKVNNREVDKLMKLLDKLKGNIELAKEVYGVLLQHENDITRFHAAGECSRLGIYTEKAKQVLEELSDRSDINNLYLETGLKMWRSGVPDSTS